MRDARPTTLVEGRIVSVQEQRFRLLTEQGQAYLFTLAASAAADGATLRACQDQQARVTVSFSGEPNLAGCVAHNLLVRG